MLIDVINEKSLYKLKNAQPPRPSTLLPHILLITAIPAFKISKYNFRFNSWAKSVTIPDIKCYAFSTVLVGNKLIVIGGLEYGTRKTLDTVCFNSVAALKIHLNYQNEVNDMYLIEGMECENH